MTSSFCIMAEYPTMSVNMIAAKRRWRLLINRALVNLMRVRHNKVPEMVRLLFSQPLVHKCEDAKLKNKMQMEANY